MSAESQLNISAATDIPKLLSILTHLSLTCEESFDCNKTLHSFCHTGIGYCVCNNGFQMTINSTCRRPQPNNFIGSLIESWPFLPILAVFVIMFICLCLVLHLFSKARFRNQARSIFVNPQALKVAQAQERRLSQLSQFSSSGLRTPKSPRTPNRSPNNSNRSQRSSYGNNIYIPSHQESQAGCNPVSPDSVILKAKARSNSISSSKLLHQYRQNVFQY